MQIKRYKIRLNERLLEREKKSTEKDKLKKLKVRKDINATQGFKPKFTNCTKKQQKKKDFEVCKILQFSQFAAGLSL